MLVDYQKPKQYQKKEQLIQTQIKLKLKREGWLVEKLHGNKFQSGFPDLYCFHKEHGHRWLEIKTSTGRLTGAQFSKFQKWENKGLGIWILICQSEYDLLFQEPNWRRFAHRVQKRKKNLVHIDKQRRNSNEAKFNRTDYSRDSANYKDVFPRKEAQE